MDDTVNTYDHRSECSGRSLATLLIAWVSAALVASVLLRWKYMWIALAILTLLFLIACGYAAKTHRRSNENNVIGEDGRIIDGQRTVPTISRGIENYTEVVAPPAYQTYWINDLPPSYTVVIGTQPTAGPRPVPIEEIFPRRPSNPPPYSVNIQPDNQSSSTINSGHQSLAPSPLITDQNKEDDQARGQVLPPGSHFNSIISTNTPCRGQKRDDLN